MTADIVHKHPRNRKARQNNLTNFQKMDGENWCTIESDPGVFTELVERLGVNGVMVEELFGLTDDDFNAIEPCFGLLFLFKWTKETAAPGASHQPLLHENTDSSLFYAKQTIHNACATQAILSILLNCTDRINVGEELAGFKEFTRDFPPEMKGDTLGSNLMIRTTHNLFARPEPFVMEDSTGQSNNKKKRNNDDDDDAAYHFIAYLPYNGNLYELDGLQKGPILLEALPSGNLNASDWLKAVRPHIEARINRYSNAEIRFNLMAVVRDRRLVLKERIEKAENEGNHELASKSKIELSEVEEKFRLWREENIRRKHNYVPFIVAALKILAKRKKLKGLVKAAQEKDAERRRAREKQQSNQ
jgi:ubiquitin carboxyl-terminal hydrolase L5